MTMKVEPAAVAAWHASDFSVRQLAAGLACDVEDVRLVLTRFGLVDSIGQSCVQAAGGSRANLAAGQRSVSRFR